MGSGFVMEDGDGTEVTITESKEMKFVEGGGIDINWTDTDNGTDADPYDLTFTINAAQSGITSLGTLTGLTSTGTINAQSADDANAVNITLKNPTTDGSHMEWVFSKRSDNEDMWRCVSDEEIESLT